MRTDHIKTHVVSAKYLSLARLEKSQSVLRYHLVHVATTAPLGTRDVRDMSCEIDAVIGESRLASLKKGSPQSREPSQVRQSILNVTSSDLVSLLPMVNIEYAMSKLTKILP